tara:strand:- start:251 stop:769 length:519 start_codon:yes stop_codon:yes gene_type:complete
MGRYGSRNFDSDASAEFFEDAYAGRFLKARDHNAAWSYFYREWSRLPPATQDSYGVEYLLGVIELWRWEPMRAELIESEGAAVVAAIGEEGPRLNAKHPGFLAACSLYALRQFAHQEPSPETRAQALELIAWSRGAIKRLGHFGGPGSKDAARMQRSLRKLEKALAGKERTL